MELDSLEVKVQSSAQDAASAIDKLAASLGNLKSAARGGAGLSTLSRGLDKLNASLSALNVNSKKLGALTDSLSGLSGIKTHLTTTANQLNKLNTAIKSMDADIGKVQQLASALTSLGNAPKLSGLTSSMRALQKSQRVLGGGGVSGGVSKAAGLLNLGANLALFREAYQYIGGWLEESNNYVENLNLFTVAMGEYASAAKSYAEEVQAVMGIDASAWMRNQGVFQQLTAGFGVVSEDAALMSKNLTQLGYDISSFYNIPIEEAMTRLQSGIAGEIEPLRRLGYAIDEASLKQVALRLGITESVEAMTQAEKSQLRYVAIMQQSTNAMGDLSRTMQTPANAIRILQQQIVQLSRALGNLLIPFLQVVIPWVQAFVVVLTEAIQALATLVGFELPTIDYSGVGDALDGVVSGGEDASGALGDATDAAKELKRSLLGFDELNVLSAPTSAAGGAGGGASAGSGNDLGLDLPEYDFLGKLQEQASGMEEAMRELLDPIMSIAAGFAAWKISSSVLTWFNDLKNGKFSKIDKLSVGIGLMVSGFSLEFSGAYDLGHDGATLVNLLKTAIGSALGIAGSLLVFGTGPLGWTIGITAAISIAIAGISIGAWDAKVESEIAERFGQVELSDEQVQEIANGLTTSPVAIKLDLYVDEKDALGSLENSLNQSLQNLNVLNVKASIGLSVDPASYQTAVDEFVVNAENYISQKQVVSTLSVDILLGGSESGESLTNFANEFYGSVYTELEQLGGQLKDVISAGFVDGEWVPDKLQEAIELQGEIQEILDMVSDAEFNAKLESLKLDAGGTALTFESFESIMEQANEAIQGQMENLDDVRLENLKLAKLQFDQNILNGMSEAEATKIYEAVTADIQKEFLEGKAELQYGAFDFGIDTISSAFSIELEGAREEFSRPVSDLITSTFSQFETDETGVLVDGAINDFMTSVNERWRVGFETIDVTPEAKAALSEVLAALSPTAEQYEKIADEARKAGTAVPENVSAGLHDYNMLAAISGDMDAINYLLGEKLSTDPNFMDALTKATDAGIAINDSVAKGLLANTTVKENADGTISLINSTIGEKVLEVTPGLVSTLSGLGVNLSEGLLSGAQTKMEDDKPFWLKWALQIWDWFTGANEINSPSKLFERGGGYIMQGLLNGMSGWESDFEDIFRGVVNGGIALFNEFIDWLNSKMRFSWPDLTIAGQTIVPGGAVQLFTIPHIPTFEFGGFPDEGELFIAREAGPELVGRIGGRTAVANNDQIVASLAMANEEVVNAVMAIGAMIVKAVNDKDTATYLDGRKVSEGLYGPMQTVAKNRGASLVKRG